MTQRSPSNGSCSIFGIHYPFPKTQHLEHGVCFGEVSTYYPKNLDVANYIQGAEVATEFKHRTSRKGVDFHYEIDRGLLRIHVRYM